MYDTDTLNCMIDDYLSHCKEPSKVGLATWLHTSPQTIHRAISGYYNRKPYGLVPHSSRIFDTKDFLIIRAIFAKSYE